MTTKRSYQLTTYFELSISPQPGRSATRMFAIRLFSFVPLDSYQFSSVVSSPGPPRGCFNKLHCKKAVHIAMYNSHYTIAQHFATATLFTLGYNACQTRSILKSTANLGPLSSGGNETFFCLRHWREMSENCLKPQNLVHERDPDMLPHRYPSGASVLGPPSTQARVPRSEHTDSLGDTTICTLM